jgi:hypothetical protein
MTDGLATTLITSIIVLSSIAFGVAWWMNRPARGERESAPRIQPLFSSDLAHAIDDVGDEEPVMVADQPGASPMRAPVDAKVPPGDDGIHRFSRRGAASDAVTSDTSSTDASAQDATPPSVGAHLHVESPAGHRRSGPAATRSALGCVGAHAGRVALVSGAPLAHASAPGAHDYTHRVAAAGAGLRRGALWLAGLGNRRAGGAGQCPAAGPHGEAGAE